MLSVIVPAFNEAENVAPLVAELMAARRTLPIAEIIYVDDGSTDGTLQALRREQARHAPIRIVRHAARTGQSAAFLTGARMASQDVLVFMDADGQNVPSDIGHLVDRYREASAGGLSVAVLGQRVGRQDPPIRRISSRLANRIRAAALGDETRDTGCSLKLIRRSDYLALPYFDHMHRFLPALLLRNGVSLCHVDVSHRPRQRGTSKYGFWNRALVGAVDLCGSAWLVRRSLPTDYAVAEIRELVVPIRELEDA